MVRIHDFRAANRGFESQKSQWWWQEEHPCRINESKNILKLTVASETSYIGIQNVSIGSSPVLHRTCQGINVCVNQKP